MNGSSNFNDQSTSALHLHIDCFTFSNQIPDDPTSQTRNPFFNSDKTILFLTLLYFSYAMPFLVHSRVGSKHRNGNRSIPEQFDLGTSRALLVRFTIQVNVMVWSKLDE